MDVDYMLACGIIWRKTKDPVAGWELIEGLKSEDSCIRQLAQVILVECGEPSINLLESAMTAGIVKPDSAGVCIAEILQAQTKRQRIIYEQALN